MILRQPLGAVQKADIDALVEAKVAERRSLEYKRDLPGSGDADVREFLADVTSFANSAGGDIVFGIEAERDAQGKPTGVPAVASGLGEVNLDAESLRLTSRLRDGIDPRIPGVELHAVHGFAAGPILVLRVPKSWLGPHMVTFKGTSRFYSRTSNGIYQLDVTEIRSAFKQSEAAADRLRSFRYRRLAAITEHDTPVAVQQGAKLILQLVPAGSGAGFQLSPPDLEPIRRDLAPIYSGGSFATRYNIDGLVLYATPAQPDTWSYVQIFRDGTIEAVEALLLRPERGRVIPITTLEQEVIAAVTRFLSAQRTVGLPLPIALFLTVTGVKGYSIGVSARLLPGDRREIDRDVLFLPDLVIEDYGLDSATLLRPDFDALWQAAGWDRSRSYDAAGRWLDRV